MAEATPYNLGAVRDDGFVDFYELLQMPHGATTKELQDRMASLNSEALANSDHRNLNKRRDYQTLREYIPQARAALLDPAKRDLYDGYAARARSGSASPAFATFMGQLSGQISDEERTDVLGVQDAKGARGGAARPKAAGTTASPTARTPSGAPADEGGVTRRQPQVSGGAKSGPPVAIIAAVVVVLIILVLFFVMKK